MDSRRYIKRVWRVPKDGGALLYLSALLVKLLVKHGWPVDARPVAGTDGFVVFVKDKPEGDLPPDLQEALEIAVRILVRTYRVDVTQYSNWVGLNRAYTVTTGGHFREEKR